MIIDECFIEHLFDLARKCISEGNRPMPAILVKENKIHFESLDSVISTKDPTMHGEIAVIRKACAFLESVKLEGYGIISFTEPCIMCCGAIHWSRIDWVAYCLSQSKLKELSGGSQKPGIRDYLPLGNKKIKIYGPIQEEWAFSIAKEYSWKSNAV